ncbi:suppressor protein SRP40-like [Iris pallida]|uniref:Suppressor protein SRP40-like n=1 Tax=Iris pallida TaxID=29817 RepID=A0AAX6FJM3_IRIPA|nr:suppressor protein SRP40-like [Iris pallida]
MADEDFEEGEVWSCVNDHRRGEVSKRESTTTFFTSSSTSSTTSSGSRMVPRANACVVEEHAHRGNRRPQSSAPVNIPDWSKIYNGCSSSSSLVVDDDGDDGDERVLPPHEWLAKKLARSQISSSSVCEGAGRTLKGRDQAKVRNAVLTKTGFLE